MPTEPVAQPSLSAAAVAAPGTRAIAAGLFALLLAAIVVLQWNGGAFTGAFLADAAAHYVTGLAVHDWLRMPTVNPIRFVIDYHAHLPMTAFGLWPPLFHGIEGLWMLAFGTGKASVILLSGVVSAAMATATALAARPRAGWPAAAAAALIVAINPLVQRASAELMLDVPCALAMFLATLAYASFVARPRWSAALGFGLLAVAAMMVKYNALALALVPPLCVLIARRWDLLLRPAFYAPALLVAILVGPIYMKTAGLSQQGFQFTWGWAYLSLAIPYNARSVLEGLTPIAAPLALLGFARTLVQGHRRDVMSPVEVACAALAIATFAFLLAVPVALQDRYLIPCVPALLVLAACEGMRLARRLSRPVQRQVALAVVAAGALAVALPPQAAPQDRIGTAVRTARAALPEGNPVLLLAGDGATEPSMLAETGLAQAETPAAKPPLWAIRGVRLLGGGGYSNADYQPRFASPAEMLAEIDRMGVAVILLHRSTRPNAWAHIGQLAALVDSMPDRFERIARLEEDRLDVVVVRGAAARTPDAAALTELSGPRALMRLVSPGG